MGAEVVGISTNSHHSQRAYSTRLGLSFPLLSDYNREVSASYVGFYEDVGGYRKVNRRGVVIVDPDRVVRWIWITEDPAEAPDPEDVRFAIQEAIDA